MLITVLRRASSVFSGVAFKSYKFPRFLSTFPIMKIGTHDGVFHCDEVLACFMLKQLPEYKDAEIIRTRNMETLNQCDIVVDVGAGFDHEKKRYDHHQREFNETLSSLRPELGDKYKIKLSSAGLIYTYYGEKVIQSIASKEAPLHQDDLKLIFKKVYENFIEEIDAIDNGVPMTDEEPKYKIHTHLSKRVGRLNPEWNSKQTVNLDDIFKKAMNLVSEEFLYSVNYFISVWLPARDYVKSAIDSRFEVHKSGQILEFTERFPWKEHLFDLEQELGLKDEIKYVIFNDKPNSWRVQAVPVSPASFITRKALRKDWWGVRDELLSDVANIKDCIFCHSNGFIGGNKSRVGALAMAEASLQELSSAGLIYTYYGEKVIQSIASKEAPLHQDDLKLIFKKVYENFIEEIDAIDNGVPMTDEEPKYKIHTHLSKRVGRLNPEWNSKQTVNLDDIFKKAMNLVSEEFLYSVNYFISVWLPARDYVKSAIDSRFEVHKSGQILEFTERFPWKEHLFDLEQELGLKDEIKYVIFNDKPNSWRVQAVPVSPASFITRKALRKDWWGVRDELLSDVANIKDCIFCHSNGFIGGNKSRVGALAMAEASLQE